MADRPKVTADIAFYLAQLSTGGVGRMHALLTSELACRGFHVDLVLGRANGPYLEYIDTGVNIVELGTTHALSSIPRLAAYLWRRRPSAILTDRLRLDIGALRALRLTRLSTRSFTSVHTPLSERLGQLDPRERKARVSAVQRYYSRNTGVIAVSAGVRSDLIDSFGIAPDSVRTVYNPVVTGRLLEDAEAPVEHPFFAPQAPPVILSAGRLTDQKDFPTLLRAFARVRARLDCRLLVLGEGKSRSKLLELAHELGIGADVSFPGFAANPYAYMSKASVFALSSSWEGLGNVLIEALAVGTPVVSTDCRFGPSEILAGGAYGPLVPVGDDRALAAAIDAVIRRPLPGKILRQAASRFTLQRSCDAYLEAFGLQQSRQSTEASELG